MKKLLSIVLAVVLVSCMAFSVSAKDLLDAAANGGSIYANSTDYATMTDNGDGSYTVVVTKDASADFAEAYGLAVEPFLTGVDLNATPYVGMQLECDVPFRITLLDKNAASELKWITFGSEFFNTVYPTGTEAPATAPENNFFPAGSYDCKAFLKGFYDWKSNNEGLAGYDASNANITAFYIELKQAGTLTVKNLALTTEEGEIGSDNGGSSNSNNSNSGTKNPNTGDTEVFALTVVALAAAVVVSATLLSKKARAR